MSSFIDDIINLFPNATNTNPGDIPSQASKTASPGTQVLVSLAIGIFSFVVFSILRIKWPALYSSRMRLLSSPPPDLGSSLFGWIKPLYQIKEKQVLKLVGLDALMILRFFKLGALLFSICSAYGFFVLIALTWTVYSPKEDEPFNPNKSWTISAIEKGDQRLIAHCVGVYLFTFLTFYFLNREYQIYSHLRWNFLKSSKSSITARSTMIQGIPEKFRREDIIRNYFENLDIGAIEKVHLGYDTSQLALMIRLRSAALRKVESYLVKWIKNPCLIEGYSPQSVRASIETGSVFDILDKTRPTTRSGFIGLVGPKVDAIKHYYELFKKYDNAVKRLRANDRKYTAAGTGFVTFRNIRSAHIASQILPNSRPFILRTDLAPEPRDIYWMNLNITAREQILREVFVQIIMIFVIFFWGVPISFIAPLLSLDRLTQIFPFLKDLKDSEWALDLLSGALPTVITLSFVSLTPYIFTGLSIIQGEKSHSFIERRAISKHFIFLLINILLVFTVANSVWRQLFNKVLKDPTGIPTILASSLPDVAPFFINYVMILGIGYFPFQLLQCGPVSYFILRRIFCSTPRDFAELLAPVFTDYGWLYGQPMLVFVAVTTYSVVAPLILGVGAIYFMLGHFVTKYCLLYVYYRTYESGGLIWPMVFRRIVVGLFILHFTMAGYFAIQEFFSLAFAMVPLIIVTTIFVTYVPQAYPDGCKYLPADLMRKEPEACQSLLDHNACKDDTSVVEENGRSNPSGSGHPNSSHNDALTIRDFGVNISHHPSSLGQDDWVDDQQFSAEPNIRTNYQQSTMFRFSGVLDSSITRYGSPALLGDLPYLWLPQSISFGQFQKLRRRRTCFCCSPISLRTTDYPPECPTSIICEDFDSNREGNSVVLLINPEIPEPNQ